MQNNNIRCNVKLFFLHLSRDEAFYYIVQNIIDLIGHIHASNFFTWCRNQTWKDWLVTMMYKLFGTCGRLLPVIGWNDAMFSSYSEFTLSLLFFWRRTTKGLRHFLQLSCKIIKTHQERGEDGTKSLSCCWLDRVWWESGCLWGFRAGSWCQNILDKLKRGSWSKSW